MDSIYKRPLHIVNILILLLILSMGQNVYAGKLDTDTDQNFPVTQYEGMLRTMRAKVIDIPSPLTLRLDNGKTVQLIGLDFPDLDYYEPGPYAVTAKRILEDFLLDRTIDVYQAQRNVKERTNRMGYELAHVARYDNDGWVQGLLLQLGLARIRTTPNTAFLIDAMRHKEKQARASKAGIWGNPKYKILTPEQSLNHIGSYQIIEGTIKSVSMYRNKIYLNFGNNWREDFTVSISAFDEKKFLKEDIQLQQWNGKHIRVRGWLESYNGPYMELDHPARLEEVTH